MFSPLVNNKWLIKALSYPNQSHKNQLPLIDHIISIDFWGVAPINICEVLSSNKWNVFPKMQDWFTGSQGHSHLTKSSELGNNETVNMKNSLKVGTWPQASVSSHHCYDMLEGRRFSFLSLWDIEWKCYCTLFFLQLFVCHCRSHGGTKCFY